MLAVSFAVPFASIYLSVNRFRGRLDANAVRSQTCWRWAAEGHSPLWPGRRVGQQVRRVPSLRGGNRYGRRKWNKRSMEEYRCRAGGSDILRGGLIWMEACEAHRPPAWTSSAGRGRGCWAPRQAFPDLSACQWSSFSLHPRGVLRKGKPLFVLVLFYRKSENTRPGASGLLRLAWRGASAGADMMRVLKGEGGVWEEYARVQGQHGRPCARE